MPKLVIKNGTAGAVEHELKPGANTLGRGFTNDIRVEDASVSAQHAEVFVEDGSVTVRDLRSTNGTFINRSQIREGFLQPGQVLSLGGVEMLFVADAPAYAPGPNDIARTVALPLVGGIKITRPAAPPPPAGGMRTPANYPAPTAPAPNLTTQPTALRPNSPSRPLADLTPIPAGIAVPRMDQRQSNFHAVSNGPWRSLGFGLGAAVSCGLIWTLISAVAGQDVALVALPLTGVGCGLAVRFSGRDCAGAAFGLLSMGCGLLGMFLGELGQALAIQQINFRSYNLAALAGGLMLGGLVSGVRAGRKMAVRRARA